MNFGRSLLAFDASSRPIALLNEEKKMNQLPDIIREWVWILDFIFYQGLFKYVLCIYKCQSTFNKRYRKHSEDNKEVIDAYTLKLFNVYKT